MPTEKTMTTNDDGEVQAIHSAPLAGDGVPTRVLLAPWGQVESTNGSFVLDDESAQRAIEAFEAQRMWAEALVAREEDLFDQWLQSAPVLVQPGITTAPALGDGMDHRSRNRAARARAEFRANPILAGLTSEEAFVADALRQSDVA